MVNQKPDDATGNLSAEEEREMEEHLEDLENKLDYLRAQHDSRYRKGSEEDEQEEKEDEFFFPGPAETRRRQYLHASLRLRLEAFSLEHRGDEKARFPITALEAFLLCEDLETLDYAWPTSQTLSGQLYEAKEALLNDPGDAWGALAALGVKKPPKRKYVQDDILVKEYLGLLDGNPFALGPLESEEGLSEPVAIRELASRWGFPSADAVHQRLRRARENYRKRREAGETKLPDFSLPNPAKL